MCVVACVPLMGDDIVASTLNTSWGLAHSFPKAALLRRACEAERRHTAQPFVSQPRAGILGSKLRSQ